MKATGSIQISLLLVFLTIQLQNDRAEAHEGSHSAIRKVTARLDLNPNDAHLYFQRAVLEHDHGDLDAAKKDFEQALKLNPHDPGVWLGFGQLQRARKKFEAARQAFTKVLEQRPTHLEALHLRAQCCSDLSRWEDALRDCERLIAAAAHPEPAFYVLRADLQKRSGRYTDLEVVRGLEEGVKRIGHHVLIDERILELELSFEPPEKILARYDGLIRQSPFRWIDAKAEYLRGLGREEDAQAVDRVLLQRLESLPPHRRRAPRYKLLLKKVNKRLVDGGDMP